MSWKTKQLFHGCVGASLSFLLSAVMLTGVYGEPIMFPSGPEADLGVIIEESAQTDMAAAEEVLPENPEETSIVTEPQTETEREVQTMTEIPAEPVSEPETGTVPVTEAVPVEYHTEGMELETETQAVSRTLEEDREIPRPDVLIDVPYINQSEDWPTGCESVTAVMLLRFLGIDISVDAFIETCLKSEPMEYRGNLMYGPDPRKAFAGTPYDSDSFGCYAPVIQEALEKALRMDQEGAGSRARWEVRDLTGVPTEELLSEYIDHGMPVIFWATIDLHESMRGPTWIIPDTGGKFIWTSYEHCMLLVGYDDDKYYFNDPWNNHGVIGYDRELVEMRHQELFYMAVGVQPVQ